MTNEWWKLSQTELDADLEARHNKQRAYYNAFYADEEGRQVLFDLQKICYQRTANADVDVARIELYNLIRSNCGASIDSEKAAIDAEAETIT